jgi:hypothetical protein
MRFKLIAFASCAALLCAAGMASAATINWDGTSRIALGTNPPIVTIGSGVATITSTSGGKLTTIQLNGGLVGSQTVPLTDPNNISLVTLTATAEMGAGSLAPIAGGGPLTDNQLPLPGNSRLCILLIGCSSWLDIPLTKGGQGVGIGGIVTVNAFGKGTHISINGGPWTIDQAKLTGAFTTNAMIPGESRAATRNTTLSGFAHGPGSGSTTAKFGGSLQFVNANFVETNLNSPSNLITLRLETALRFVPEPGLMLLLGSGVAGLTLLGRNRMRK